MIMINKKVVDIEKLFEEAMKDMGELERKLFLEKLKKRIEEMLEKKIAH